MTTTGKRFIACGPTRTVRVAPTTKRATTTKPTTKPKPTPTKRAPTPPRNKADKVRVAWLAEADRLCREITILLRCVGVDRRLHALAARIERYGRP